MGGAAGSSDETAGAEAAALDEEAAAEGAAGEAAASSSLDRSISSPREARRGASPCNIVGLIVSDRCVQHCSLLRVDQSRGGRVPFFTIISAICEPAGPQDTRLRQWLGLQWARGHLENRPRRPWETAAAAAQRRLGRSAPNLRGAARGLRTAGWPRWRVHWTHWRRGGRGRRGLWAEGQRPQLRLPQRAAGRTEACTAAATTRSLCAVVCGREASMADPEQWSGARCSAPISRASAVSSV